MLEAARFTFDHVVDVTLFLINRETTLDTVWKVLGQSPIPAPSRGIGVAWLYEFQFELKVIVQLPDAEEHEAITLTI